MDADFSVLDSGHVPFFGDEGRMILFLQPSASADAEDAA